MIDPLEILRRILCAELIFINILAWILADINRLPKPAIKMGEFRKIVNKKGDN